MIKELERTRTSIKPVVLLGRFAHPMELTASPYHRLLTTIAVRAKWIKYTQIDTVSAAKTGKSVRVGKGKNAEDVPLLDLHLTPPVPPLGSAGEPPASLRDAFLIARYGTDSPLIDLFKKTPEQVQMIRRQQSLYADQDQLKESYARKIAANLGFNDPYDIKLFYHDNQDLIEKYFKGGGLLIHLENSTPLKFRLRPPPRRGKPSGRFQSAYSAMKS